jgi:serpin B
MGMKKTFSMMADFSEMGEPSVMVDRVIHKTHIELDRNGTKAAAATAVIAKEGSVHIDSPIEIRMDRPFVYALVDNETGIPLFIGSVKTLK